MYSGGSLASYYLSSRTPLLRVRHAVDDNPTLPPAAILDPEPLRDADGIYGYRMERLYKLDFESPPQYEPEV